VSSSQTWAPGLGGPAAWMRSYIGCSVVASDPSPEAVAGAHRLFGLVTVQATAASAPFAVDGFDAVLLLGVLSVVDDWTSVVREARRISRRVGVLEYCSASAETLCVGGSRFPTADGLAAELATAWDEVRVLRVDEPSPASWDRAAERAHDGVQQPNSEREVVDAIESGKLVAYALVGRQVEQLSARR
jgi:SAM-dependent methyltransferase